MKGNGEISMNIEKNVQIVKDFFEAIGRRDEQVFLSLSAENIEWIVPGEAGRWPRLSPRARRIAGRNLEG